ncbi:MAG TPA: UpxY family transcription antiterminator [Terriglobales bacterium]|nr:UpxY family transcription antiterminator [Terriglobales bacterium]
MNTTNQIANAGGLQVPFSMTETEARWYAIRTRSRHEKVAARDLEAQGIPVFLPLATSMRQWSDRRTKVEMPLFPGYAFVRVDFLSGDRVRVLQATGVVSFVGPKPAEASIPDEQIESIRTILLRKVPIEDHPFLTVGQRIRVRSGSLSGVEGILVAVKGSRTLVISVEPIQRSVCIRLEDYEVETV